MDLSLQFWKFFKIIIACFSFHRLIKTLLEENINGMSDHVNKAMDKIEFYLDSIIADKKHGSTEKSDAKWTTIFVDVW